MHTSHTFFVAALCLSFAGIACATGGTQRIASRKGGCEMTVPANWKADSLVKGVANSPDGSMSAVISAASAFHTTAKVKPIIESTFKPTKVFEDSPQRLWYAYAGSSGSRFGWYVGVPGRTGFCGAQIGFKHAAQATLAKQIALSVKPSA